MKRCRNCKRECLDEFVDKNGFCEYCTDDGEVGGAIPGQEIGQEELSLEPEGSEVLEASYGYETL